LDFKGGKMDLQIREILKNLSNNLKDEVERCKKVKAAVETTPAFIYQDGKKDGLLLAISQLDFILTGEYPPNYCKEQKVT
jgi:hypothetical protein